MAPTVAVDSFAVALARKELSVADLDIDYKLADFAVRSTALGAVGIAGCIDRPSWLSGICNSPGMLI